MCHDTSQLPGTPAPARMGCGSIVLDVSDCLPDHFYYQDRYNKYMGGLVIVHDKKGYKKYKKSCKKKH
jgi:hypothetical protein